METPRVRSEILTTKDPTFDGPVDHRYVPYIEPTIGYAAIDSTFWLCSDGCVGRVPDSADVGDRIMILLGGTVSILLRLGASDYVVQGEAYVDDTMDGQAFSGSEVQVETITVV